MRARHLVAAVLAAGVLGACSSSTHTTASSSSSTTTTVSADDAAYCRLMQRTDAVYRSADASVTGTVAVARAERERVDNAPGELRAAYAYFAGGSVPLSATERIQDWTQQHCGFLPTFNRGGAA
ncbi:MAG TPA: hypothetical protein VFF43_08395 [Caldimonas sp.]|nr:hypothetical protein [Caldimonas sp.]